MKEKLILNEIKHQSENKKGWVAPVLILNNLEDTYGGKASTYRIEGGYNPSTGFGPS